MENYFQSIEELTKNAISILYQLNNCPKLYFQYPKKRCLGDISLILFSLSNKLNDSVENIGQKIGKYVKNKLKESIQFFVIKGFLNFKYKNHYYFFLIQEMSNLDFCYNEKNFSSYKKKKIMVEYSSPNTNKSLHLGHLRNILIGSSISNLLKIAGHKIIQTQIINDRGIHICKSMLTWKKFGKESKPNNQIKGDHFVGYYYRLFETIYHKELKNFSKNVEPPILIEARKLLKKWEKGDVETRKIWNKMNQWVYHGFKKTYKKLDIIFDKTEYESKIYNFSKEILKEGLKKNIFFQKEDGSIWFKINQKGYDSKLLLRSDQTSVYLTQDIGNAVKRFQDYPLDKIIYVVGKEQDDHFKILFFILNALGYIWVDKMFHLSYNMVLLPNGKMQSRSGNIITIDHIISKMIDTAKNTFSKKYSKLDKKISYEIIGLCALKYHFLQVDPQKEIVFDPLKSIDFKGKTGIYIQYTYSRIRSLEEKFFNSCMFINYSFNYDKINLNIHEKNMIKTLQKYPSMIIKSIDHLNPSILANYIYEVSKTFNHLYQKKKLIDSKNKNHTNMCMNIIHTTGNIIKFGMNLLGIKITDRI